MGCMKETGTETGRRQGREGRIEKRQKKDSFFKHQRIEQLQSPNSLTKKEKRSCFQLQLFQPTGPTYISSMNSAQQKANNKNH